VSDNVSALQPAPIVRYPSQSRACEPVASWDAIAGVVESRYRSAEVLKLPLVRYVPDNQEMVGENMAVYL
jgi:hypothetical protein